MTREKLLEVAARLAQNGWLRKNVELWFPDLAAYNALRREDGLPPVTRDEVPSNIHFASEIYEGVE